MTLLAEREPIVAAPRLRIRRGPMAQLRRWIGRRMPTRLFPRALLIVVVPLVLLQGVVALVFMERHWHTVTERLSKAVVSDIAAVLDMIEALPAGASADTIVEVARDRLSLNVSILPDDPFPPAAPKPFFSVLDGALRDEIGAQIGRPFWIDTVGASDMLEIRTRLQRPQGVLRVYVRRNSAYASNSHIFIVWMVGTSLVLLTIAAIFLRNQIVPIQMLARAAESYGKGRALPGDFRIRGAREVRLAALSFLQMRERIDKQIQQRTAMLTGVSHDLRTLLTRFKLQLALVGESEDVDELQADVDEMQRMLQGYLDFARGESAEAEAEVDLGALLRRHVTEAAVKKRTLEIACPPGLTLRARPLGLARLVANLVSNAFRHAHHLVIRATPGPSTLTITFDDDGPGIPEGKREEVFRPFIRLDEARNQDEGGTGLGLAIARGIARSHGGDIHIHQSPLGGARIIVRLPL